ncbi:hypothetical protein LSUCC0031_02765 [Rhodobacterales bacterium LSUCC0031]|nr:hypothetical protein [Rhodobacterales bacterium LSUCC0031]
MFLGAVMRAAIVVLVVATPSLMLPGTTPEGAELAMLLALVLAGFTASEYSSLYPAMIEFRDAPPFNRLRLISLCLMVFALSLVASGADGSSLVLLLSVLGLLVGQVLTYSGGPLAAIVQYVPMHTEVLSAFQIKAMAGIAFFIACVVLGIFALMLRMKRWPDPAHAFNVWINLPTFDPTAGGDVINRLIRDARVNAILGFVITFILPTVGLMMSDHFDIHVFTSLHGLVWGVALWMFLPLSLFMRALALARIAAMIREQRARLVASINSDGPQPA